MSQDTTVTIQVLPNDGHRTSIPGSAAFTVAAGTSGATVVPNGGRRTMIIVTSEAPGGGSTKTTIEVDGTV